MLVMAGVFCPAASCGNHRRIPRNTNSLCRTVGNSGQTEGRADLETSVKSLWEQNGPDYRPDLELGKFQMVHGIEIDIAGSCSASELTKCAAAEISVSPHLALLQFKKIGGANGWYFANILWWLRGASDLLAGGSDAHRDDGIHTRWRRVMLWISGESRALNWTVVFIRLVALDLAASFHSLQDPQRQLRPNEGASDS